MRVKNLIDKLSIQEFYALIRADRLTDTSISLEYAKSITDKSQTLSFNLNESGTVNEFNYANGLIKCSFSVKKLSAYPIFLMTAHNLILEKFERHVAGCFIFYQSSFYYFGELPDVGYPDPMKKYMAISSILKLDCNLEANEVLTLNLNNNAAKNLDSNVLNFRLAKFISDGKYCIQFENREKDYKPEMMKVYFDLLDKNEESDLECKYPVTVYNDFCPKLNWVSNGNIHFVNSNGEFRFVSGD